MPTILIMMLMKMVPWSEDKPSTYTPTTPIKKRKFDWLDYFVYGIFLFAITFGVLGLLIMILGVFA